MLTTWYTFLTFCINDGLATSHHCCSEGDLGDKGSQSQDDGTAYLSPCIHSHTIFQNISFKLIINQRCNAACLQPHCRAVVQKAHRHLHCQAPQVSHFTHTVVNSCNSTQDYRACCGCTATHKYTWTLAVRTYSDMHIFTLPTYGK